MPHEKLTCENSSVILCIEFSGEKRVESKGRTWTWCLLLNANRLRIFNFFFISITSTDILSLRIWSPIFIIIFMLICIFIQRQINVQNMVFHGMLWCTSFRSDHTQIQILVKSLLGKKSRFMYQYVWFLLYIYKRIGFSYTVTCWSTIMIIYVPLEPFTV